MTPLAYLILDNAGRMVDSGGSGDFEKLAGSVARLNDHSEANAYRLAPVAEIPAWQPIETAPKDEYAEIILGRPGESSVGAYWEGAESGMFSAHSSRIRDTPAWTHWQPLPAAPEVES